MMHRSEFSTNLEVPSFNNRLTDNSNLPVGGSMYVQMSRPIKAIPEESGEFGYDEWFKQSLKLAFSFYLN